MLRHTNTFKMIMKSIALYCREGGKGRRREEREGEGGEGGREEREGRGREGGVWGRKLLCLCARRFYLSPKVDLLNSLKIACAKIVP